MNVVAVLDKILQWMWNPENSLRMLNPGRFLICFHLVSKPEGSLLVFDIWKISVFYFEKYRVPEYKC